MTAMLDLVQDREKELKLKLKRAEIEHDKEIKERARTEKERLEAASQSCSMRCITYIKCSHFKAFEISNFNKINEILDLLQ